VTRAGDIHAIAAGDVAAERVCNCAGVHHRTTAIATAPMIVMM
jgi:hypothetical protein